MNFNRLFACTFLWSFAAVAPFASAAELLPADRPIESVIDHYVDALLAKENVTAAPQADDANRLRRTMLDLVGRIPTPQETREYIDSGEAEKRQQLVDRLLATPAYIQHQANEFDTMLMNGMNGSLREYLLKAFEEKRPWDQMFREMLLGREDDPEQKGALQFVKTRIGDIDKLANETSVMFFGVNVSCAKCHDHPLVPEWTQQHFFGMKSFFNRTFDNGGLIGERDYGLVKYTTTSGESHEAKLMFLTGTLLDEPEWKEPDDKEKKEEKKKLEELKKKKQPPPAPSFSRRAQLVDVALRADQNNYFAKAIVNKIWNRFFGRGLVMPIDQMHPENVPSHPELLDWLARDLVAHKFDLSRLVRGMVLSNAYSRSSRWDGEERPYDELFAVAQVRPLSPHQYASLLKIACTSPDQFSPETKPEDLAKRIENIQNAARGIASLIETPNADFQVSVAEALLFNNSDRIEKDLLRDGGDTLIGKLKSIDDPKELVRTAGWSILNREPDEDEAKAMVDFLASREEQKLEACRLLVWALITSSECRFNY